MTSSRSCRTGGTAHASPAMRAPSTTIRAPSCSARMPTTWRCTMRCANSLQRAPRRARRPRRPRRRTRIPCARRKVRQRFGFGGERDGTRETRRDSNGSRELRGTRDEKRGYGDTNDATRGRSREGRGASRRRWTGRARARRARRRRRGTCPSRPAALAPCRGRRDECLGCPRSGDDARVPKLLLRCRCGW